MKAGKLIIFSAPSGAGKTTIVKEMLKQFPELEFSITATTRAKRPNEINGVDYYFISPDDFKMKIQTNEFIEWEEVYKDQYYGTLKSELKRIFSNNHHVVFDIDVYGGLNIKKQYNDQALAIFIKPPSLEVLETRLKNRSTETEESLQKRINKAVHEMSFASSFDYTIINDNLEKAIEEAQVLLSDFLKT